MWRNCVAKSSGSQRGVFRVAGLLFLLVALLVACVLLVRVYYDAETEPAIGNRFDNATSFFLYCVEPRRGRIPGEEIKATIQNLDKEEFDLALFKRLVCNAEYRDDKGWWKGSTLGIVTLADGSEIYLAVSMYGSFFEILGEKGRYVISDGEGGTQWKNEYRKQTVKLIEKRTPWKP